MSLQREEIVLLNCFNYLNIGNQNRRKLGVIVNDILERPDLFNRIVEGNPAGMGPDNWRELLESIRSSDKLCSLILKAQSINMGYDPKGLNAVCFMDPQTKEATFVFRGTGRGEWLDNGIAFSGVESPQQVEALQYFEKALADLKLQEKGYTIDVTGHSKGGNKAQYITIRNDVVNNCFSFDGQGFSDEALKAYRDGIARNRHKIISIAADKDYVHCLGNEIAVRRYLYETKYSLLKYGNNHSPDAIIREGKLQQYVPKVFWVNKMINRYSTFLMKLNPNLKREIFTSFMGFAQMNLGKGPALRDRIPSATEAKKSLLEANMEFKNWFSKDRNEFSLGQKIALATLNSPIFKLIQFLYNRQYQDFSKMEEQVFGTLSEDLRREFGESNNGRELQNLLESSKEELQKQLSVENKEKLNDNVTLEDEKKIQGDFSKHEIISGYPNKIEQVLEFEPKEAVDKLSGNDIEQMLIKRDLFISLKNKGSLTEVIDNTKDFAVKFFCKSKLNEVNVDIKKCIENLNKHTALHGDIKSIGLDEKNNYLLEKTISSLLPQKNGFNRDNNLEKSINDLHLKNNNKLDINEFCKLSMELEENRDKLNNISERIKQIDTSFLKFEQKEKLLVQVEKNLKVADQMPADTHNRFLLFRKKDQKMSIEQEKAMSFLKSAGITNWKEYGTAREALDKSKIHLNKLDIEKKGLKSEKESLIKAVLQQNNIQKEMMKYQVKPDITRNNNRNLNKKKQMER